MLYFWADDFGQLFGCFEKGICTDCGVTVVVEAGVIEGGARELERYPERQRIFPPLAQGNRPDLCEHCAQKE